MTEEQIKQKAENVYMRCFDDDFKYKGVLRALEICARETATEATKELQEKNNQLEESRKRDVEVFEIQGEVELRDVRIYDLNKKVTELEKENAELKETLKNVRCALIQDKNAAYISLANDLFDLQVSKGDRK